VLLRASREDGRGIGEAYVAPAVVIAFSIACKISSGLNGLYNVQTAPASFAMS